MAICTVPPDLDEDLLHLLRESGAPIERTAAELMVLELYRRRAILSGKAAELLGMVRFDLIRYASGLGIPYVEMTVEEWDAERRAIEGLSHHPPLSLTQAR